MRALCVSEHEKGSSDAGAAVRADARAKGSECELNIKMYWAAEGLRLGREWTGR